MASKLEMEVEVKSSAEKFWGAIRESTELFPKIFPNQYKSIVIVEGDGKSVGTVRFLTYGEEIPVVKTSKERVEVADDANKLVSYSVIEGEILTFYKIFRATLQVVPKDDGASAKWSVEYEKVSEEVPEPEIIKELAVQTFKDLDAYLLDN